MILGSFLCTIVYKRWLFKSICSSIHVLNLLMLKLTEFVTPDHHLLLVHSILLLELDLCFYYLYSDINSHLIPLERKFYKHLVPCASISTTPFWPPCFAVKQLDHSPSIESQITMERQNDRTLPDAGRDEPARSALRHEDCNRNKAKDPKSNILRCIGAQFYHDRSKHDLSLSNQSCRGGNERPGCAVKALSKDKESNRRATVASDQRDKDTYDRLERWLSEGIKEQPWSPIWAQTRY